MSVIRLFNVIDEWDGCAQVTNTNDWQVAVERCHGCVPDEWEITDTFDGGPDCKETVMYQLHYSDPDSFGDASYGNVRIESFKIKVGVTC